MQSTCLLCKATPVAISQVSDHDTYDFACNVCGFYRLSGDLVRDGQKRGGLLFPEGKLHLVIRYVRLNSSAKSPIKLDWDDITTPDRLGIPEDIPVGDKIRNVLLMIAGRTMKLGQRVEIGATDWPLIGAVDLDEVQRVLVHLQGQSLIDLRQTNGAPFIASLTVSGHQDAARQRVDQPRGNKAFVAMWFDATMTTAWTTALRGAISEAEYQPVRMDAVEHNEKVCDKILAEIRSSALVVADFTGNRSGVYFEAGFAMGLGIPVIWTCREDWLDKLHFDTRQYNHIVWSSVEQLKSALLNRIQATVPRKSG